MHHYITHARIQACSYDIPTSFIVIEDVAYNDVVPAIMHGVAYDIALGNRGRLHAQRESRHTMQMSGQPCMPFTTVIYGLSYMTALTGSIVAL